MQVDTVKLIFTYVMALVVVVGGGAFLLIVRNDTPPNDLITGAAISVVTLAVQFVFTKETATQASRAAESAFSAGAGAATGQPPAVPGA